VKEDVRLTLNHLAVVSEIQKNSNVYRYLK